MNQGDRREERKCEGVGVEWINRGSDAFRMGVHRGMSMSLSGFTAHSPSS